MNDDIAKARLECYIRAYDYLLETLYDLERDIMEAADLDCTDENIEQIIDSLLEEFNWDEKIAAEKVIEYAKEVKDYGNM